MLPLFRDFQLKLKGVQSNVFMNRNNENMKFHTSEKCKSSDGRPKRNVQSTVHESLFLIEMWLKLTLWAFHNTGSISITSRKTYTSLLYTESHR